MCIPSVEKCTRVKMLLLHQNDAQMRVNLQRQVHLVKNEMKSLILESNAYFVAKKLMK